MFYIILIGIIIIFVIYSFRSFRSHRFSTNSYTWGEVLWPFNSAPKQIYSCLSPENKGAFWSLTSSVLIGVLSCWLGFSVQYFVYNSTQSESDKLARYQVVDKFRPLYMELYDTCSMRYFEGLYKGIGHGIPPKMDLSDEEYLTIIRGGRLSPKKENSAEAYLIRFMCNESNRDAINHAAERCIDVSHSIAPYLDKKNRDKLLSNNSHMLINLHLSDALHDTTTILDSLSFIDKYVSRYIQNSIMDIVPRRDNVYELYSTAYSLYKECLQNIDKEQIAKFDLIRRYIQLTNIPLIENMLIITDVFYPKSYKYKPIWMSVIILFICIFIGYMVLRIIMMRFFDPKSLKPNPQKSWSDLQKLEKELERVKRESRQAEINIMSLSSELKKEREHSKKSDDIINEYKELIDKYQKNIELLQNTVTDQQTV